MGVKVSRELPLATLVMWVMPAPTDWLVNCQKCSRPMLVLSTLFTITGLSRGRLPLSAKKTDVGWLESTRSKRSVKRAASMPAGRVGGLTLTHMVWGWPPPNPRLATPPPSLKDPPDPPQHPRAPSV